MLRRWAIVIGLGIFACVILAFASFSLRVEKAPGAVERGVGDVTPTEKVGRPRLHARPRVPGRPESGALDEKDLESLDIEALIDLLGSPDNETTKRAARKLEDMGAESVPALVKRLETTFGKDDSFDKLRWWSVNALGNIRDKSATPVLVDCAALDKDPHTRWRSIWALNVIGDERRVDMLRQRLESKDELERFNVATALSTMDVDDGVEIIEETTKSKDNWLRWQAVSALGKIKSPKTLSVLVGCLSDPEDSIRQEAAMSLGRLGDKKAVPALIKALGDPKPGVRWRAARSLGQLEADEAVPSLIELLDDKDGSTRSHAAVALADLGNNDPEVARKVIGMLSDPDKDVRNKAAMVIGTIGSEKDVEAVNEALGQEKDEHVKRRLERSLRALQAGRVSEP